MFVRLSIRVGLFLSPHAVVFCFFAFWNIFIFRDVDLETIRKERKSLSRSHKQCATSAIAKSKDVLFHKQSTKNNNRREKKRAERFAMG